MVEYIDRSEAINAFWSISPENDGSDGATIIREPANYSSADIEAILSDIPAADVAPVVHAHWIDTEDVGDTAQCSACNECYDCTEEMFGAFAMFYHYCPNCGAKMDEVTSDT